MENFFVEMNIDSLIINLIDEYPTEGENIRLIKQITVDLDDGKNPEDNIQKLQDICDALFKISSKDILIDFQVIINEYRYKYDVTDPKEIINWDNGRGFVQ